MTSRCVSGCHVTAVGPAIYRSRNASDEAGFAGRQEYYAVHNVFYTPSMPQGGAVLAVRTNLSAENSRSESL